MGGSILTFASLLVPIIPGDFFAKTWENEPLHIPRGDSGFYEQLLTNGDVEAAITSGGLRYPAIQLAKGGGFLPPEAFTRTLRSGDDMFTGIPVLDCIRAEYHAGATISLPGFHRASKPLGTLAAAIECELDHPVHANVYITPANSAGFTAHYDTHEVFVLQIAGSKRWWIERPLRALPHRTQPFDPRAYRASPAVVEVELKPGDLLYLPRGFVHRTATSDGFSLHVTLGVTVFTWVELLTEWSQSSKNELRLRRALPPGFASRDEVRESVKRQLSLIVAELQRSMDYDRLVDGVAQRIRAARATTEGGFSTDAKAVTPRIRPV